MAIKYSDGVQIESQILGIVNEAKNLAADSTIGLERYNEWPVRYHLCPERANLFRHLDFSGLDVLELGAGMGAVSRYLSEKAKTLTVVEGTDQRFSVLSSRLRDRENWSGIVSNIQDVPNSKLFDVVCLIGVLEYSELYIEPSDQAEMSPFMTLLAKAVSFLKPDGIFILALENQLGLKYWSGVAEDHTGRLFDGICGYAPGKTPKTFSRKGVLDLMSRSGLSHIDEYYPFPDYKISHSVLSRSCTEKFPDLSAELAVTHSFENYGNPRRRFFPDILAAKTVARGGLLSEFANSFLFVGSFSEDSPTRKKLLRRQIEGRELAWYYSTQRRFPTVTVFTADESALTLTVSKLSQSGTVNGDQEFQGKLRRYDWRPYQHEPLAAGVSLSFCLCRYAYFERWDMFVSTLESFLAWSFRRWADSALADLTDSVVSGSALDAVFLNATMAPASADEGIGEQEFELFDLEWSIQDSIPKSWFILRNVFGLVRNPEILIDSCPFMSLYHLYLILCERLSVTPDFDADIDREAEFQMVANREPSLDLVRGHITFLMKRANTGGAFPRKPPKSKEVGSILIWGRKRWRIIKCSVLPITQSIKSFVGRKVLTRFTGNAL